MSKDTRNYEDRKEYKKQWLKNKIKNDPAWYADHLRKHREYARKRREKLTPDEVKAIDKERNENAKKERRKDPRKAMLQDAKKRAKLKKTEFNLTVDDIIIPELCPVLGIPLFVVDIGRTNNSPSLDRFDNDKGYIRGNVFIISFRANTLKNNATVEEISLVLKYMKGG